LEKDYSDLEIQNYSPSGAIIPRNRQLPILKGVNDYLVRFWYYPKLVKGLRSDIFHIVDHANAYLIGSLDTAKAVVTCHDLMTLKLSRGEIPYGYEDTKGSWFASGAFKYSSAHIPKANKIIAASFSTKSDLVRLLNCKAKGIKVIYYGIDRVFSRMIDRERVSMQRRVVAGRARFVLLNIGSRSAYKNFAGLLHAFRHIVRRYGKEVFLIRIGGVSKKNLGFIEKFNLRPYMRILPWMPPSELTFFYNLADLFVFPSLYEGFGWPPVEAMACGLPVVSSDKGGLKEAVGEAAYIIDPYDANNISSGIIKALEESSLRGALIAKGLERAKRLKWEDAARETNQIYRQILN